MLSSSWLYCSFVIILFKVCGAIIMEEQLSDQGHEEEKLVLITEDCSSSFCHGNRCSRSSQSHDDYRHWKRHSYPVRRLHQNGDLLLLLLRVYDHVCRYCAYAT